MDLSRLFLKTIIIYVRERGLFAFTKKKSFRDRLRYLTKRQKFQFKFSDRLGHYNNSIQDYYQENVNLIHLMWT